MTPRRRTVCRIGWSVHRARWLDRQPSQGEPVPTIPFFTKDFPMHRPFPWARTRERHVGPPRLLSFLLVFPFAFALLAGSAFAHAVAEGDKGYIQEISGVHLIPFIYLGAKHMITGYDHLLFLAGVIFFLYRLKDISIYVTLFAIGHSTTMLLGVYFNIGINSYIIDAIIGLSVAYKALDNMGAFQRWLGFQPNTKGATLIFGLFHGFGLSSKILDYNISPDGLVPNLLAFNVGVEIGQLTALAMILIAMGYWRRTAGFWRHAYTANVAMLAAGFLLFGYQLTGLAVS
jgi:hypothetical protein